LLTKEKKYNKLFVISNNIQKIGYSLNSNNFSQIMSILKKLLTSIFTLVLLFGFSFSLATPTYAQLELPATCNGPCPLIANPQNTFGKGTDLRGTIAGFILGAARILTFLAVAVAIVYMIWGGYKWMDVNDPKGAETGQKIVTNAAIGLAVTILAYTIVGLIAGALQGDLTTAFGGGGTTTTQQPADGNPPAPVPGQ
jgi:Type IV secretion system pilin